MAYRGFHSAAGENAYDAFGEGDSSLSRAKHARLPQKAPYEGTERYSRDNYGSNATGPYARTSSRRADVVRKAGLVLLAVAAASVIAAGSYLLWFSNALNSALAPSSEERSLIDAQLVDSPIDKPFYLLLLGSDSREGSGTSEKPAESGDQQRSDVIILARVDATSKQITLVSIPRDTPYTLDDGTVVKINEVYNIGGAAQSIKAVSQVTGVDIAHYAEVHVSELEAIVDAVGGIEVYVDRDLKVKDTLTGERVYLREGRQTLNGQQAQAFARARHAYAGADEGQDYHRQSNVRTLLKAIIAKVLDRPATELPGVILKLAHYVTTDLNTGDLVSLALSFSGGGITMYSCTGPSAGESMEQYNGMWLCYPNPEGWAELMRQVDSGEEPQEIDYEATQIVT